ncbi:MAG: hypothetical protein AABW82_04775 [Nanoarchaeota archaeon]
MADDITQANVGNTAKYVDPNAQDYVSYFDHLKAFNDRIQRKVSGELGILLKDVPTVAVATTGSDARLEKGPVSLIELMLFFREPSKVQEVHPIVRDYAFKSSDAAFFEGVETKNVETDLMHQCDLYAKSGDRVKLISPNRIFDAGFLAGDEEVLRSGKRKLISELVSEDFRSVVDKMRDKVKEHRKVTLTGKQRYKGQDLMHYDIDAGIATYDPSNNQHSFKQGPLRAVQFALVSEIIRGLRSGYLSPNAVVDLPSNTVSKLHDLEVGGLSSLSTESARDLADSYKFFLHKYHQSQSAYSHKGLKEIGFDSAEVRERCKLIDKITSSPIVRTS